MTELSDHTMQRFREICQEQDRLDARMSKVLLDMIVGQDGTCQQLFLTSGMYDAFMGTAWRYYVEMKPLAMSLELLELPDYEMIDRLFTFVKTELVMSTLIRPEVRASPRELSKRMHPDKTIVAE
jgi:hypothetical protein